MLVVLRPYSKSSLSLTFNEWKFNLSFSRVSLLFLNSWRASVIPYYVTTHPPAIQNIGTQEKLRLNLHSLSVSELLEYAGLKISFTEPSDKMSDDVEFGSDICPMTFGSVLTRK